MRPARRPIIAPNNARAATANALRPLRHAQTARPAPPRIAGPKVTAANVVQNASQPSTAFVDLYFHRKGSRMIRPRPPGRGGGKPDRCGKEQNFFPYAHQMKEHPQGSAPIGLTGVPSVHGS